MKNFGIERPPVARTTEGQPNAVGANGKAIFAHRDATGKPITVTIPRIASEQLVKSAIDLLGDADGDADCVLDELDAQQDNCEPEAAL